MGDDLIQQPELPEEDVRKPLSENIDALEFFRSRTPKATKQFQHWMEYPPEIRRTDESGRKLLPASRETNDKSAPASYAASEEDRQPRQFLGDLGSEGRPAEDFRRYLLDSKVLLSTGIQY
jgi:hypothetical protein